MADRWHVWNNLAGAVERTIARRQGCLTAAVAMDSSNADDVALGDSQAGPDHPQPPTLRGPDDRTDRWAVQARERHAAIHALLAEGVGINAICRRLGLARHHAPLRPRRHVQELLTRNGTGRRPKPYLHQRWNAGCANATTLLAEITARGYRGGPTLVRHYLHHRHG